MGFVFWGFLWIANVAVFPKCAKEIGSYYFFLTETVCNFESVNLPKSFCRFSDYS